MTPCRRRWCAAWRNIDRFEGRSSVRSWLYRIATNVCLDMLRGRATPRARRWTSVRPRRPTRSSAPRCPKNAWVTADPRRSGRSPTTATRPRSPRRGSRSGSRSSPRCNTFPPRQRAVLILREVLRWQATEVAELLDTSVASVNSALQRARATLAEPRRAPLDDGRHDRSVDRQALLARYVDAFERYDITSLVSLLRDDAVMSMPPYDFWLRGPVRDGPVVRRRGARVQGSRLVARDGQRLRRRSARTSLDGEGGHKPWAIQVIEISATRSSAITTSSTPICSRCSICPVSSTRRSASPTSASSRPTSSSSAANAGLTSRSSIVIPRRLPTSSSVATTSMVHTPRGWELTRRARSISIPSARAPRSSPRRFGEPHLVRRCRAPDLIGRRHGSPPMLVRPMLVRRGPQTGHGDPEFVTVSDQACP